jgi:L-ribulose-5-phosphate 3-epimerase
MSNRPKVALFSKPLSKLGWNDLGRALKQFGLQNVELTVRPRGHVLPERVREDLPRAVEALAAHGVAVPVITTAITSASHPTTRPILETAASLKISSYRLGYWRYDAGSVETKIVEIGKEVQELVAIGKSLGIQAGWHNHSGEYVGEAVWDIRAIIRDLDPAWIGYFFDLSHATSEGGVGGWEVSLRLALPRLKMVVAKDHLWDKVQGRWTRNTCPLGQGMVNFPKAFSMLAAAGYSAPVSVAVEYEAKDIMEAIARDVEFVNGQIDRAFGSKA